MMLFLKLLLAHIIGDFLIQPEKWVKDKEKKKLKSPKLYLHVILHIILMLLIIWDISLYLMILSIGLLHFIIDAGKLLLQKKKNKRYLFFIDQLLHITTIVIILSLFTNQDLFLNFKITEVTLLLFICILFLTKPTSIIMRMIFTKWKIEKFTKDNESLKDAGQYIGILERLLVFTFIIIDHWEAVGFLITAKSVFRFGDLTASKERKLTEYILIGTLISFGVAIIIGLTYKIFIPYV